MKRADGKFLGNGETKTWFYGKTRHTKKKCHSSPADLFSKQLSRPDFKRIKASFWPSCEMMSFMGGPWLWPMRKMRTHFMTLAYAKPFFLQSLRIALLATSNSLISLFSIVPMAQILGSPSVSTAQSSRFREKLRNFLTKTCKKYHFFTNHEDF